MEHTPTFSNYLRSTALFSFTIIILFSSAFSDVTQIGLAGKKVTALLVHRLQKDTLLIAGTKNDGVWYRRGSAGTFQLLDNLGAVNPSPFLTGINSLALQGNATLFAGSDSGLAVYMLVSMIEPMWRKIADIPARPVTDIIVNNDTVFCCTGAEVYRSFDKGSHWTACNTKTFLPPFKNVASFTSLAFWEGINAGSRFGGTFSSWLGVINSRDNGSIWHDTSLIPPQTHPLGEVFDLAGYRQRFNSQARLLAATSDGLKYIENDLDTGNGYWHPFEIALKGIQPASLYIGYQSKSLIAEIFVCSDSGAYALWLNEKKWTQLTNRKTNCIVALSPVDADTWFVGTDDGVWSYTKTPTTISAKPRKHLTQYPGQLPSYHPIAINGRNVGALQSGLPKGVFFCIDKNNMHSAPIKIMSLD